VVTSTDKHLAALRISTGGVNANPTRHIFNSQENVLDALSKIENIAE